jgi:hypothetical protein
MGLGVRVWNPQALTVPIPSRIARRPESIARGVDNGLVTIGQRAFLYGDMMEIAA